MRNFTFIRMLAGAALSAAIVGWGAPALADSADGLRSSELETVVVRPEHSDVYRLGPGDHVRVTVYNEEDLSGEFQVDGSGFVRLPLIGQIKAGGKSAPQLEGDVEASLDNRYLRNPRVSVEVTTYRPFYILGEVGKPGQYPYVSNMSALDAIALAGGFSDRARESDVYIRHEGQTDEQEMPADESVKIRPGDVVRVKQTVFWSVASVLSPAVSVVAPAASLAYILK